MRGPKPGSREQDPSAGYARTWPIVRQRRWRHSDYLLKGEFCPAEEIPPALEDLRRHTDAHAAILIVAGPRGLLRTLCSASSRSGPEGHLLAEFLRETSRLRPLRSRSQPGESHRISVASATEIIEALRAEALRLQRPDVPASLGDSADWLAVRTPEVMLGMALTIVLLLRDPAPALIGEEGSEHVVDCGERLISLAGMVSATANASVHRDTMITTRVDDILDPPTRHHPARPGAPEQLIILAAEVTNSNAAAFYRHDAVARTLTLAAEHIRPGTRGEHKPVIHVSEEQVEIPHGEEERPADPGVELRTVVAAASYERRRPVAYGTNGPESHLAPTFTAHENAYVSEMATPVPGPPASARAHCVGVVTVTRFSEEGTPGRAFGAYDHALLRNLVLRLALLRATGDMEAAASMFAQLAIRGALVAPATLEAPQLQAMRSLRPRGAPEPALVVPDDIAVALPAIRAALADIVQLTQSHSATFRAALPDPNSRAPHGLSLMRVAAHPQERMHDPDPIQDVTNPGVNCRAALTGIAQNVPDVESEPAYQRSRGSASEISAPVTLEGMVVGVVNLESPSLRNYDARVATVIAFAEHLGSALANARLALARDLHGYAMRIITRGHDLSHESEEIAKATRRSSAPTRARLAQILEELDRRMRGIRDFAADAPKPGLPDRLVPLAREAWKAAEIEFLEEDLREEPKLAPLNGEALTLVYECVRHVFVNVQEHTPVEAPPARVSATSGEWGGRSYQILRVLNHATIALAPERAVNLYRVPVFDTKRDEARPTEEVKVPRFGAYLAGNQARLLGGDVHLALRSPKRVSVTVMIPEAQLESRDG